MKRRKFIWVVSAAGGLMALAGWFFRSNNKRKSESLWAPATLSQICSREKLTELGREYRLITGENDSETIKQQLLTDHQVNNRSRVEFLKWRSDEDFRMGDTLLINGWLLSSTEARQCALLSLLAE